MPTFAAPSVNRPLGLPRTTRRSTDPFARLWRFYERTNGADTVWITTNGTVLEGEGFRDPDDLTDRAQAGTGVNARSVFRFGASYTINGTEDTQLQAAGYVVT